MLPYRNFISMGLALGAVSRLFTRHLYAVQNDASSMYHRVALSPDAVMEIDFGLNNFLDLVGQPIWHSSPCINFISYSDASSTGWVVTLCSWGTLLYEESVESLGLWWLDTSPWSLSGVGCLGDLHTVDRLASLRTKQLPRFCSRWLCPGCEGVDAFTLDWSGENNWLVPPVFLVSRVLNHMFCNKETGTLVVPQWPSALW